MFTKEVYHEEVIKQAPKNYSTLFTRKKGLQHTSS